MMRVIDLQGQWERAQAAPWEAVSVAQVDAYAWQIIHALGEYPWHQHDDRDDCLLVLAGCLGVELPDDVFQVYAGQMLVVPRGVPHRTFSVQGARVLLFEPVEGLA